MTFISMKAVLQRVKIFCGKSDLNKGGSIKISVNDKNLDVKCDRYLPNFDVIDYYCINKNVEIDLTKYDSAKNFFNIKCIIESEVISVKNKTLYKLCKNFPGFFFFHTLINLFLKTTTRNRE